MKPQHCNPPCPRLHYRIRTRQCGQSTMEYVVLCAALVFALGIGMVDDQSTLRQLLNAFVLAYKKISFAIALP